MVQFFLEASCSHLVISCLFFIEIRVVYRGDSMEFDDEGATLTNIGAVGLRELGQGRVLGRFMGDLQEIVLEAGWADIILIL